ncbi:hypothetical protein AAFF_G00352400 [Aldrovandia affinis]|uniref:Uncharacterized protein n=1 Tax=Aldrovandia affinis TaxID=143900 RepID=A0AAD7WNR3_9TELE|nr:hypothetical protein AAFF_G00352400 [Aldrovandia affinis]
MDEFGDLLTGIIESQQPLEGIPDDDHLGSAEEDDLILTQILEGLGESQEDQPKTSPAAASSQQQPTAASVSYPGSRTRGKRLTIHEKLAIEFHE